MIHVIATIETQPGQRNAFLSVMQALVPQVLAEEGCVEYAPTVDLETGIEAAAPSRSDAVTVVERWESVDALKKHLVAPHMQQFREQVGDLVADLTIRIVAQPS